MDLPKHENIYYKKEDTKFYNLNIERTCSRSFLQS